MKIALLTKEYPPYVYGGAGVHVAHLAEELARLERGVHDIRVWSFGDQDETRNNLCITGIRAWETPDPSRFPHPAVVDTLTRNAAAAGLVEGAELVHCHTWYTHLAGCLVKQMLTIPLVLTTHSLEPHRPWKKEQLGRGYFASRWLERTAYENADGVIAVSNAMKQDVHHLYGVDNDRIEVIPNGIDPDRFKETRNSQRVRAYGIDPEKPYILMVARITRQKGILHYLQAVRHITSEVQVVLCASAPDTAAFMDEVTSAVAAANSRSANPVIWAKETVPVDDLIVLYSHAALFVCPSIYEPFGIILLEAMACGVPVVASHVGGIPDVVADGKTGRLVSFEPVSKKDAAPGDPAQFAKDLAGQIDELLGSPEMRERMAHGARKRVVDEFTWTRVAERTLAFYRRFTG